MITKYIIRLLDSYGMEHQLYWGDGQASPPNRESITFKERMGATEKVQVYEFKYDSKLPLFEEGKEIGVVIGYHYKEAKNPEAQEVGNDE